MPINKNAINMIEDNRAKRIFKIVAALTSVVTMGTIGYVLVEGWPFLDALFMSVITLSTVGYGETRPLTPDGRIFTMMYIVAGVSVVTYSVGALSRMVIEGELYQMFGRKRAMTKISRLKDHYVICGFGRIGQMVAAEFERRPLPFVIIEKDETKVNRMPPDYPAIVGDATEEESLINAGIERAKGLVTVLHSDAANLFVTLSAREINPNLYIIARHEEERSKNKLLRAGADKVVSPYIIGGTRMAMAALKPAVIDFIELATQSESLGLQMEEILVQPGSPICDTKLMDSNIRSNLDIIIVAIKKANGHMMFNPNAQYMIQAGDQMIAIGETEQLRELEKLVALTK